MKNILAFLAGLIFAIGLCLSGMTNTGKVIGFLDIFGSWDPSLMFVMMGAIGIHLLAYHLWLKKKKLTLFGERLQLPMSKNLETKLFIGAAIFGIGWGLAGFCPGPALVSLLSMRIEVIAFVACMIVGMIICDRMFPPDAPKKLN